MNQNTHFFSWDARRDIAHPGDFDETLSFCAEHFVSCAKEAIKMHGFFTVALSGGSTPKALYAKVSHPPYSSEIDWSKCFLFWSDERSVPPTDQASNFWMALEAGFKSVSIPIEQVCRMEAEADIAEHADAYEQKIKSILGQRPFDLLMLGVGTDGHTASLFPKTPALKETEKWVVANPLPKGKGKRMTLTYPCINRSSNIVIYALGQGKQEIVKKVFLDSEGAAFPVSKVGSPTNKALWIVDSEAGKALFDHLPAEHTPSKTG